MVLHGYARNAEAKPLPPERHDEGAEGYILAEKPPLTAEQARKVRNLPGLYATLEEKTTGKAHRALLWSRRARPFEVTLGEQAYTLRLRPQSWQLPFRIGLKRFVHEYHPGTQMPRRFSSYVNVMESGQPDSAARDVHITMNEPLREGEYTLYQSSWGPQMGAPGRRMYSGFAVVRNPSDQVPLYACIVIGLGLLVHFGRKLYLYLKAEARKRAAAAAALATGSQA